MLGFLVIAALAVATILLWRNMNKQIRKVRFDDQRDKRPGDGGSDEEGGEGTDAGAGTPARNADDGGTAGPPRPQDPA
jgi:hypothetical protein